MSNLFPDDETPKPAPQNPGPPQQPVDPNQPPPPQMVQGQVPPGYQPPPGQANPYAAPQGQHAPPPPGYYPNQGGDSTGGVIPYKNPHALIAYYLGIVALFPVIGVPFGIASIILGISGLRKRKQNPIIKGSAHAWIGIAGGVFSLICGGIAGLGLIAMLFEG